MSIVNSYNNWDPLEEVWLGDVYPTSWYDHLPSEVQDCFQELTERTKQDLDFIEKKLQSLGVTVCRPNYRNIDDYINPATGQLDKPEICPRDNYVTIGETLYAKKYHGVTNPWQKHIDRYEQSGAKVDYMLARDGMCLSGANTVRAGRDLYFDLVWLIDPVKKSQGQRSTQSLVDFYQKNFAEKFADRRVHILFNGGHVDACFSLLKPGVILGSRYFEDYATTFPGWQLINVTEPQFAQHNKHPREDMPGFNGKWWIPDVSHSGAFNDHIIKHAQTWIGNYTETFFEVNCLVVDEHNVVIPGENEAVFRALEKLGITAHAVPFRTRTFWDGGMHCITVDIRRRGGMQDYFPERNTAGIQVYG
jgi:hypothetical protein